LLGLTYLPTAQRLSFSIVKATNLKYNSAVDKLEDFRKFLYLKETLDNQAYFIPENILAINWKKVSSFIYIRSIHKNITSELKKWKSYSKKENSSQSRNHWARIQWDTSFWPATDSSWNNDISCDAFASKYPRGKLWLLITFVKMAAFYDANKVIKCNALYDFVLGKIHWWSRVGLRFNRDWK